MKVENEFTMDVEVVKVGADLYMATRHDTGDSFFLYPTHVVANAKYALRRKQLANEAAALRGAAGALKSHLDLVQQLRDLKEKITAKEAARRARQRKRGARRGR